MTTRMGRYTPLGSTGPSSVGALIASARASARPASRQPTAAEIDALCVITPSKLRALSRSTVSAATLATYAASLERHRRAGEINTLLRVCHFLAQLAHESGRFSSLEENFTYRPANAKRTFSAIASEQQAQDLLDIDDTGEVFANHVYASVNGNTQPGDGYRYRGRGFIQLTGRYNYKRMSSRLLNVCSDLVGDPDLVFQPDVAARVAVSYWREHSLNAAADRDDIEGVTRPINAHLKGIEDRRQLLEVAKSAFYPRP